jgi:hypothetical protein
MAKLSQVLVACYSGISDSSLSAKLSHEHFYSSSYGETVTAAVHIALLIAKLSQEHILQLAKLSWQHMFVRSVMIILAQQHFYSSP